jgi:flagellar hook-associated protein 1 FlgK
MTDLVSVASNAVASYQRALGTVSNNIANVSTEGYSRQEVVLQSNPTAKIGNVYLGTGVMIDRVKRQYDTFAELNLRNSNSDLASQEPMVNYANRVIDIMGSDSMGLSSALDKFFNTSRELSADPASTVKRTSFIRDSQGLASRFGQLSSQLDLVQSETNEAIKSYVSQVNTLASQLAQVNQQMTKQQKAETQPPDLLDQRDVLLKSLSSFAHINTRFNENGSVSVSLGPSFSREVIVEASRATQIGFQLDEKNPEKVSLILDPYGNPQPLTSITSGKISGMLAFREQILGTSRNSLNQLAELTVRKVNELHEAGIDAYGIPGQALFKIGTQTPHAAANIETVFDDPLRVAVASQFRIIEAPENVSGIDAHLSFEEPKLKGPPAIQTVVANNGTPEVSIPIKITGASNLAAVATVPNGLTNVSLLLSGADAGQTLQVFTRDGRQIAGTPLSEGAQASLLGTPENGFNAGASYSSEYINNQNNAADPDYKGYRNLQVFYGARAEVGRELQWDMTEADPTAHVSKSSTPIAATLTGHRIPSGQTSLDGGLFQLNGTTLDIPVSPANGETLQASDFARWINDSGVNGITASSDNKIFVPQSQIKLTSPLFINGIGITPTGTSYPDSTQELVSLINAQSADTHVLASLSDSGNLTLTNAEDFKGNDIVISNGLTTTNALGLKAQTYTGTLSITSPLADGEGSAVELTFVEGAGSPAELDKLGISTGVYIKSNATSFGEDLLVFATGAGSAALSATYSGAPVSAKQSLRAQNLVLNFDATNPLTGNASHFTIKDKLTGTVLASREFDATILDPGIEYLGLALSFSNPPVEGDSFEINGNQDGTANNENMLLIAGLDTQSVTTSGKTLSAAYIDQVNDMGNIARQATIAKEALTVVYDQAVASRDEVSGVSLDDEAADLIRYQQAYQAAAKILQISSQLFDSVLQVR